MHVYLIMYKTAKVFIYKATVLVNWKENQMAGEINPQMSNEVRDF